MTDKTISQKARTFNFQENESEIDICEISKEDYSKIFDKSIKFYESTHQYYEIRFPYNTIDENNDQQESYHVYQFRIFILWLTMQRNCLRILIMNSIEKLLDFWSVYKKKKIQHILKNRLYQTLGPIEYKIQQLKLKKMINMPFQ
ncbi:unnamed protein product [Paramecium pentaurelia]|uniref:Uncharacterized protein n=1 Tax=Paramecium pentaurelia TaxID=43138 RepID=A0A8S1WF48_9CILI|nr:unnamed protein product [Paramecium pentaurelia]